MKKFLVMFAIFTACLTVAMTSVNAWAMAFSGDGGTYYETTGSYNSTFKVNTTKLRHISGSAINIQAVGLNWVLIGYTDAHAKIETFNTTTLNEHKYWNYSRIFSGKAKGEWTGWSGGQVSADLYLSN